MKLTEKEITELTKEVCLTMGRVAEDAVMRNIMMQYIRIGMTPEQVREHVTELVIKHSLSSRVCNHRQ